MINPFFKNNGPFKFDQILNELNISTDKINNDLNVIDIKDLQNSKAQEITFFHSKKYKLAANNTKASFCITTKNLHSELPKNCIPIIIDNVLVSTSVITSKFYPDSINDDFDNTVEEINNNLKKFLEKGEQVLFFLNRRGYAPYLICKNCGYKQICNNCSMYLTFHKSKNKAVCHHCSSEKKIFFNQTKQIAHRKYVDFIRNKKFINVSNIIFI